MNLDAIILAGGPASRDESGARALIPVAGEPIVRRALSLVEEFKPDRTVVVADLDVAKVAEAVDGRAKVVEQVSTRNAFGSGHAVGLALKALGEVTGELLIVYADRVLLRLSTVRTLRQIRTPDAGVSALTVKLEKPAGYSRIIRDERGAVKRASSDCAIGAGEKSIQEVVAGAYWFHGPALASVIVPPDELDRKYNVCEALGPIVDAGGKAVALPLADPDEAFGVFSSGDVAAAEAVLTRRGRGAERLAGE